MDYKEKYKEAFQIGLQRAVDKLHDKEGVWDDVGKAFFPPVNRRREAVMATRKKHEPRSR